jgi:hypothetical protein
VDAQKVPIEQIWNQTNKERDAYEASDNRVEEHAHLKIERLLTVVVHKLMFFLIGGPQDQRKYKVPKGNKVL